MGGKQVAELLDLDSVVCCDMGGTSFDAATGKAVDPYQRWVIYVPFATPQPQLRRRTPARQPGTVRSRHHTIGVPV